jgi:carbon-monoxide dehydrogenase large subunit
MSSELDAAVREELVGQRRTRPEDVPLVRGEGTYTDDLSREGELHLAIHRSQYGSGRIDSIDTGDAEAVDGVVAVFTGADLEASGSPGVVGPLSGLSGVDDPEAPLWATSPLRAPDRPILASDRVHYTGEPVAAVLAEDRYAAAKGADAVAVDYERGDAVVHPEDALEDDAPTVHEEVSDNLAFDWEAGNPEETEAAFEAADRTVSVEIAHQRVSPVSMEPRTALAEFDDDGGLVVHMGTQGPHRVRTLMESALGIPAEQVRVIAPEVGGGFGCKSKFYPGEPLAAWCAQQTERPVKWQATRTESQRSDIHGRARTVDAELAFDDDGTIRGLRADSHANLGAYVSRGAPGTRTGSYIDCISGQYRIPGIHVRVRGVLTNTSPVDSYRGSSRPMTLLTVERLVHKAARDLDMDPAEFRRHNFIDPEAFPYQTPVGERYDSGQYAKALDQALDLVDYEGVRARQADRRERREAGEEVGSYLGVGFCNVMDNAGTGSTESARIRFDASGAVTAFCGTADQGQGHRTAFAQLVGDLLGVPFEDVTVEEGDTADVPTGGGASGSRSVVMGGEALRATAESVVEKARPVAAAELEADPADVTFEDGTFAVEGTPERNIGIQEVARLAYWDEEREGEGDDGTDEDEAALEAVEERTPPATFPFGTHVAVVEVDGATGEVSIEQYVAVDDCGVQLNPRLVEGQIVGGVVNGLGQALWEDAEYDDNGTLTTGSLQDYAVPRSHQLPDIDTGHTETPSPYNELGVKGAGESGATGAPAATANAVADALEPLGIDHVDLPLTDERVWSAMRDARGE